MTDVIIASAARTPIGAFSGAFATVPAADLGKAAIAAAMERSNVAGAEVDDIIMGQVLTADTGQNPARQAAMAAARAEGKDGAYHQPGLRLGPARRCDGRPSDSGRRRGDRRSGRSGEHEPVSPRRHMRAGTKMGDVAFTDTMIKDGLWDAFNGYHMGTTAENVAEQWQITRDDQGRLRRRQPGQGRSRAEIRPVRRRDRTRGRANRKGDITVDADEYPRHTARRGNPWKVAPGVFEGRHRDGRQRFGHQRRRGGVGPHVARAGGEARRRAVGPYRVVGDSRRRSGADGLRPDSGEP